MALNKYESYKSCPIPCPINMLKPKSWRRPARGCSPCSQESLTSKLKS